MMDHWKIQHNPTFLYPYRLMEQGWTGRWKPIANYATLLGAKRAMLFRECERIQNLVEYGALLKK